nr:glutathione S-transferase kappa 1 [Nephromyces sp. MMRI]AZL94632.1 glutathione S-transferase kappa 1 [Nephromyces sp. MMRI]
MKNDFVRMAKWAGLNLKVPSAFPIISLNAMRLLTLVKNTKPEFLWSASMALFKSYWQDSANIADNQVLANSLQDYAGFTATQANELVELSQNSQNKQNLMKDTDEAINIGLFGCPTFLVKRSDVPKQMYESLSDPSYAKDYEIFFGADRIPVMAFFLELPYFGSLAEKELNPNLAKI